jgi:hypothetical protein
MYKIRAMKITEFSKGNQMVRTRSGDQGVDERTILKWILKKDVGWNQLPEDDPVVVRILWIYSGSIKGG